MSSGVMAVRRPCMELACAARLSEDDAQVLATLTRIEAPGAVEGPLAVPYDAMFALLRRDMLAVHRNAGLDVRDHLDRFIALATAGDAEPAFECPTIIEQAGVRPENAVRCALRA